MALPMDYTVDTSGRTSLAVCRRCDVRILRRTPAEARQAMLAHQLQAHCDDRRSYDRITKQMRRDG